MNKFHRTFLLGLIACFCNIDAHAGQKLRVYFIGNSYTYTNNMPGMIAAIATSMGDTLVFDDHTPGGWTLEDHWAPPQDPCVAKIKKGNWDYVVLQEQSQMPVYSLQSFRNYTYPFAELFNKLMRDSAKCTMPLFYMTWGYKNGDSVNCPSFQHMCTYESMDSILRTRYMEMADSFNALVSPVGAVRRYIRQNHPGIELYTADGSHPSVAGTYAAACCFYAVLFKKDPSLIIYNSTLSAADAATLKAAAKKVVYDSLAHWVPGMYDLTAAFTHSINGNTVTFTNTSSFKAQTYSWNFGDGNTSTLKNPVHTYATPGNYNVVLTTSDANGCDRVVSGKVNLLSAAIAETEDVSLNIIPNPATRYITITHPNLSAVVNICITNAAGQAVYKGQTGSNGTSHIDVSAFSNGVYFVTVYNDGGMLHCRKFIKQ